MVVWTQLLNAITMASPFYFWLKNRKKHRQKLMHKFLLLHIPISFGFHVVCSFGIKGIMCNFLKLMDLSMIHIYSIVSAREIKLTNKPILQKKEKIFLENLGILLNVCCVLEICKGYNHEHELFRIASIIVMGYSTLCYNQNLLKITKLGLLSSLCYLLDEHLYNLGHPLFHIMLGGLYNELFSALFL